MTPTGVAWGGMSSVAAVDVDTATLTAPIPVIETRPRLRDSFAEAV